MSRLVLLLHLLLFALVWPVEDLGTCKMELYSEGQAAMKAEEMQSVSLDANWAIDIARDFDVRLSSRHCRASLTCHNQGAWPIPNSCERTAFFITIIPT